MTSPGSHHNSSSKTFCFLLQQIRKWTTRMGIWLTCDFSTGQNHLKQDSYPNVWASKLFLFPPRVPRLREGRQSAERKAALTQMNTVTTNKIGSAFPDYYFCDFLYPHYLAYKTTFFQKICVCVCVCVSVCLCVILMYSRESNSTQRLQPTLKLVLGRRKA